jgi:hypothetical protein
VHFFLGRAVQFHTTYLLCLFQKSLTAIAAVLVYAGAGAAGRAFAEYDPTLVEIVRRHFDLNAVAYDCTDAETPHLSSRIGDYPVFILEQDAKAPVRKNFIDQAVEGHEILFGHYEIKPTAD